LVSAAFYLTVTDIGIAEVAIDRDAAVAPVLMYQAFMSIVFRLELSNYDDPRLALATCIAQSALEIALRLTVSERDAWVKRVSSRLLCFASGRQRSTLFVVTTVAPDSHGHKSSVSTLTLAEPTSASTVNPWRDEALEIRVAARLAVKQQFRSRMILLDMWGECAGIYISSVVLFLGQCNALYYPFRPFRKYRELFDGGNFYGELAIATLVQIMIEIITDTICLVFEGRRGLQPLAVWHELRKAALTPVIILTLTYAAQIGQSRSFTGDTVTNCNGRDVCWCVGDGLRPNGVREGYCLLLYPNSSGQPTA
jgi:hypothetical protein